MRKIIVLIALLIGGFSLSAQSQCDCKAELDFVYAQIKTAASFKSQMKGEKLDEFESAFQELRSEFTEEVSVLECFWKLQQLKGYVKDKHLMLYGTRPEFGWKETE